MLLIIRTDTSQDLGVIDHLCARFEQKVGLFQILIGVDSLLLVVLLHHIFGRSLVYAALLHCILIELSMLPTGIHMHSFIIQWLSIGIKLSRNDILWLISDVLLASNTPDKATLICMFTKTFHFTYRDAVH